MADSKGAALAFGALGVATLFVVSGIKGVTLADVLNGKATDKLDPTGGVSAKPIDTGKYSVSSSSSASGVSTGVVTGTGLPALKAEMDRMAALKSYYQWAGSHIAYNDNGPWDCSSAVSQALHKAGLMDGPPRVSGMFMAYGLPGPGKHVTIYSNANHVYMVVDGRTWQWRRRGTIGGYSGPMPTGGFVARHPEGL